MFRIYYITIVGACQKFISTEVDFTENNETVSIDSVKYKSGGSHMRNYFSDRVPSLVPHPDDAKTFLAKLVRFLGGADSRDVVMVLAEILCEALGEDVAEMHTLFTDEGLKGFRENFAIHLILRNARMISGIVRRVLKEHFDLPAETVEVSDPELLDRMVGLLVFALSVYIESARNKKRLRTRSAP